MNKWKKQGVVVWLAVLIVLVLSGCSERKTVFTAGLTEETGTYESAREDGTGTERNASANVSGNPSNAASGKGNSSDTVENVSASNGETFSDTEQTGTEVPEQNDGIYVFVCGAVNAPGVYELSEDARVYEALALAGGFADGADEDWLNQAETVSDGERIYVYTLEETRMLESEHAAQIRNGSETGAGDGSASPTGTGGGSASPDAPTDSPTQSGKVNLNTAAAEELMTLPGIGEAKAAAILAYREEHGGFSSIEEIQNISGIKTAVFSKIKDKITV